ncbi:MAG: ribose 5-phosphate isomerase A [Chloroflexaceae bacterium]|nr:ribose 5-phosphate isomerase A [Chloroflexaceae bacterium]NJO06839.1 ribose 5-phosphate isomerase A [Chloroflexaceae bacterium]
MVDDLKRVASEAAVQQIEDGMLLGLGTGTTVRYVLDALARRLREGTLSDVRGVPTSHATAAYARKHNIPLTTLEDTPQLDLAIDGADEVAPNLDLIKGRGGALLREKIVACASARLWIVIDTSKRVERLGALVPLPVEVLQFGWKTHLPLLYQLGAIVEPRLHDDGQFFTTDNGNIILDCRFPQGIGDAAVLSSTLERRAGIIGHGLFLGIAERVFIGAPDGIREMALR